MRSLPLLIFAVIVAFQLTACGSWRTHANAPQGPLPEAARLPCPEPAAAASDHPDAVMMALKVMYDLYGACAGRYLDTVRLIEKREQETRQ